MRPEPDEREAEKVASLLAGSGVTTVVINACRSAAGLNEASNIARLLVQTGIKFAIGMSFNVLSLSADRFMRDFYNHFFAYAVSPIEAVSYARGQLRRNTERMSKYHTKVNIEDHLVPIIHCQESELSDFHRQLPAQMSSDEPDDVPTMPSNLIGREGDILRLEWMLTQFGKSRVHIQGHPGSGKTSLLEEAIAWWQKTGLFQQVIYIQLTDPQFQDCTAEVILKLMAKELKITIESSSIAAIIAALNTRTYLLVLDSLDSIRWSSTIPNHTHERQLWMCLRKLKSCSVVILSRTADSWLGNAIQSRILLEPVDFPNAIAIGTGILQDLDLSSKLVATEDDQSYFVQLVGMSQGNPLAIKVMMYDLARHFAEEPSMTLESHLMSILQLRPIFIDTECLSYGSGARAIAELLEWIYDDIRTDSELYKFDEGSDETLIPLDHQFIVSMDSLGSLSRSIRTIKGDNEPPLKPITSARLGPNLRLARSGFHSAMVFNGFWHNINSTIEPFVTTLAALIIARRFLKVEAINMFRTQLCEVTEGSIQDPNYVYNTLFGKSAFGLSPIVAHYCRYAATKALSMVHQILTGDLYHFVDGTIQHQFGNTTHYFKASYYAVNPLVSLVSQSSIVRAICPSSLAEDIEVARDSLYRHRISTWLNHKAHLPSTPYNEAMQMELDHDFYNYLCLMLSYQQLNSWPVDIHWQVQHIVMPAAVLEPRRLRLVERVLNRFICGAFQHIGQVRRKYYDLETGGYVIESQERNPKDWKMVTALEIACREALQCAMTCRDILDRPNDDYLTKWNYVETRPMFLDWKYTDPFFREVYSRSVALGTRWNDILQSGGKFFDVKAGQDYMNELTEVNNLRRKFFNLSEPIDTRDTSLTVPAQIQENAFETLNIQGLPLIRAGKIVNRLRLDGDRASVETILQAVQDLEKLLLEEIEHNNSVLSRLRLHSYLATVHTALGSSKLARQHRTIREELKAMLKPEVVESIERHDKLWTTYHRDSHRINGEPVNEAQRLERQLDDSRARLSVAEAEDSPDHLNTLDCVETVAFALEKLGRDEEAVEHYGRAIQGRQRLLPANDEKVLSVIFARSKLLGSLGKYEESIQDLRMLRREHTALGDRKVHNNVIGSLGLGLVELVRFSGSSLAKSTQQAFLLEARDLLKASVKMAEELYEPGDLNISATLSNIAYLHEYQKDYNEAEACRISAIRVDLARASSEADIELLVSRNNLACLWVKMHRFQEAKDLYTHLLEVCIDHYEMWHPRTLITMSNLVYLFNHMKQSGEASIFVQDYISQFYTSLEDSLQVDKRGTIDMEHAKYQLGRTLTNCECYEEATLLLEQVAAIWREQKKRDNEMLELLTKLRYCYFAQQPQQLEREYQTSTELIELRGCLSGPQHMETLDAIATQVICLRNMNRVEEAVEMQLSLKKARKTCQGTTYERILSYISYLAGLYEDMEDWLASLKTR